MKKHIYLILFLLIAPCINATTNSIPSILLDGFRTFKDSGSKEAVSIWLKRSPIESELKTVETIKRLLSQVEEAYGKYEGWEIIRVVETSPSVQRFYITIKFEHGPLFAIFDCYKQKDEWTIFSLDFNTKLDSIRGSN